MSDTIFNKLIDFRHGTQDEFNLLIDSPDGVKPEDLYYIEHDVDLADNTITLDKLYVGTNLLGDAYNSQYIYTPSKVISNTVGRITAGMTLAELLSLSRGSVSKVIDLMLFTDSAPTIDEFGIIAGFIPSIDVDNSWTSESNTTNWSRIATWIEDYAQDVFSASKYNNFNNAQGIVSSVFSIQLDPSISEREYDENTGIYTGRMFVAIPYSQTPGQKDITTIVDRLFNETYTGQGLVNNFLYNTQALTFGDISYQYKIYLFGRNQSPSSYVNFEYAVQAQ